MHIRCPYLGACSLICLLQGFLRLSQVPKHVWIVCREKTWPILERDSWKRLMGSSCPISLRNCRGWPRQPVRSLVSHHQACTCGSSSQRGKSFIARPSKFLDFFWEQWPRMGTIQPVSTSCLALNGWNTTHEYKLSCFCLMSHSKKMCSLWATLTVNKRRARWFGLAKTFETWHDFQPGFCAEYLAMSMITLSIWASISINWTSTSESQCQI